MHRGAPWPLSSDARGLGGGTQPLPGLPEMPGPQKLPPDLGSEFPHTRCQGTACSPVGSPQRAPRAARGQPCTGVLRSGLGECGGLAEHRGGAGSPALRAGAGRWSRGIKQRVNSGRCPDLGVGWCVRRVGGTPHLPEPQGSFRPQLVGDTCPPFPGAGTASRSGRTMSRLRGQALCGQLGGWGCRAPAADPARPHLPLQSCWDPKPALGAGR